MKRIGHKGAHTIEAGNTIASFEVARDLGVDMIEFDVLRHPYPNGELVIAHDPHDAASRADTSLLTLAAGLDHLAGEPFAAIALDVDMKHRGFESELLSALGERDLLERTTITTMHHESLLLIGEQLPANGPRPRLGITIPKVSRDYLNMPSVVKPLLAAGVAGHRVSQPARVTGMLRRGEIDLVMAFHAVISARLVRSVHEAGGEIYAWTVDEAATIAKLFAMGVDGVVTNDPRLFDEAARGVAATA